MLRTPTSQVVLSRRDYSPALVQSFPEPPGPWPLRPTGQLVLALLAEHEVLTTTQLLRLLALPGRTVQHRLGCLYRRGLVNRFRPDAAIGTSPYHCWLTSFGAAAVGAEAPGLWSEDLPAVRTTALLTELWLSVRDRGAAAGLNLRGWRRLRSGLQYRDSRTGAERALPVEAELKVALGDVGTEVTALVAARVERVPAARVAALLGRFAAYAVAVPRPHERCSLLVLVRTQRLAASVLDAASELPGGRAVSHLGIGTVEAAMEHVAVGVAEPRPVALATGAVWRTPACRRERRLAELLATGVGR
jgi:hypothetical protein